MYAYEYLIAVATVNGPERLEAFLKSVREHTSGFSYAISICDDCSDGKFSEENYKLALKYGCYYRRNATRSGVPYSWNRACEASDTKFIVVANDDILVCPGWLEAEHKFRKANDNLNLGVIAWPATNDVNSVSKETSYQVGPDAVHISNPIVACAGYLFCMPRKLYWEVGGFDERYFATWEEIDFGAKLCMNGIKSIGLSAPVIYHQGGASFSDPINQHPAMKKQSLAQQQWIDKWSTILNIKKSENMIRDISIALVAKIPSYRIEDFKTVSIKKIVSHNEIHGWFDWEDIYLNTLNETTTGTFVEVGSRNDNE